MTKFTPESVEVVRCREMRAAGHSLVNIAHETGVSVGRVHYFCNEPRFGPRIYPKGPLVNADGSERERATMHRMTMFHGVSIMRPSTSLAKIRIVMAEDVDGGTLCTVKYFIPTVGPAE